MKIDDHEIEQLEASVAQNAAALADERRWIDVVELQRRRFAREGERTQLQEAELALLSAGPTEADRELDLDRGARPLGADAQQVIEDLGEMNEAVLQDRCERDQAHARA